MPVFVPNTDEVVILKRATGWRHDKQKCLLGVHPGRRSEVRRDVDTMVPVLVPSAH